MGALDFGLSSPLGNAGAELDGSPAGSAGALDIIGSSPVGKGGGAARLISDVEISVMANAIEDKRMIICY
ncbi:MAG: hypothetical protein HON51_12935 [Gammaproteobacteria bacterium]|nr:hypothetical protein [Gammaproteobacteria bacterium]